VRIRPDIEAYPRGSYDFKAGGQALTLRERQRADLAWIAIPLRRLGRRNRRSSHPDSLVSQRDAEAAFAFTEDPAAEAQTQAERAALLAASASMSADSDDENDTADDGEELKVLTLANVAAGGGESKGDSKRAAAGVPSGPSADVVSAADAARSAKVQQRWRQLERYVAQDHNNRLLAVLQAYGNKA
jgi:hypothetical protein